MSFEPILSARAHRELLEGWKWYEDKQQGLGDKFKKEVYDAIAYIILHPEHFPQRKRPYYESLIKIFPYLIIYRVLKKERFILISSIFHASQNPRKKYK
jgi:plasmid stabilization system protein ParE